MRTWCACVVLLLVSASLASRSQSLSVTLIAPPTVEPGGFIRLILTVRNDGPTDLISPFDVVAAVSSTSVGAFSSEPDWSPESFPPGWTPSFFHDCALTDCSPPMVGFRTTNHFPSGSSSVFSLVMRVNRPPGATNRFCGWFTGFSGQLATSCTSVTVSGSGPVPTAPTQLSALGGFATNIPGQDLAYDPVHRTYLLTGVRRVSLSGDAIAASRIDFVGQSVSGPVDLIPVFVVGGFSDPRVAYSADLSDGINTGGFMVTWRTGCLISSRVVFAQPLSLGPLSELGCGSSGNAVIAYSETTRQFLVVWHDCEAGCQLEARRVGLDGQPIGPELDLGRGADPQIAWNPVTDEFGIAHTNPPSFSGTVFTRVSSTGVVLSRRIVEPFASSLRTKNVAVNTLSGNYVVVWNDGGAYGAELNSSGEVVSTGLISAQMNNGGARGDRKLAFNPVSETFLLVNETEDPNQPGLMLAVELNQHGAPMSAAVPLIDRLDSPVVTSRTDAAEWRVLGNLLSPVTPVTRGIVTSSRNGGTDARLGGCTTPDPFASLGTGSGFCYDGGWLPPGFPVPGVPLSPAVPPPPAPPPAPPLPAPATGCTTPDPFVSLGGGTCANGGWYPPGITPPAPLPPGTAPLPGGCTSPDPFVSIGGGICVNGGWRPRGG